MMFHHLRQTVEIVAVPVRADIASYPGSNLADAVEVIIAVINKSKLWNGKPLVLYPLDRPRPVAMDALCGITAVNEAKRVFSAAFLAREHHWASPCEEGVGV